MSYLGVGNKFKTKNVVPEIEKILSGTALDEPEEEPKTEKVDGRTKEYKSAVKRMSNGGRRKDGPDGRTKSYKETVSRIAARASNKDVQVEESTQLNELFSDVDFVIDQLSNSMEHFQRMILWNLWVMKLKCHQKLPVIYSRIIGNFHHRYEIRMLMVGKNG